MTEPTAEATAWLERAKREESDGVLWGARQICPDCHAPMNLPWGNGSHRITMCYCGTEPLPGHSFEHHGLESVKGPGDAPHTGTITYG